MPTDLASTLRDLELKLLDAPTRKSPAALDSLLTGDFVEFGSSGRIFDRAAIATDLAAETPITTAEISSFRIVAEAQDLAVVTYHVSVSRPRLHPAVAPQLGLGPPGGPLADALSSGHTRARLDRLIRYAAAPRGARNARLRSILNLCPLRSRSRPLHAGLCR